MLNLLRIFFSAPGLNPWLVVSCLVIAGVSQAFGVATLVPLLQVASGGLESAENPISIIVVQLLGTIGFAPNVGNILGLAVFALLLKPLFLMLAMTYVGYAVAEVATNLRLRLVDALLTVRWSYFSKQPLGTIANAVSLETHRSANAYSLVARMLSQVFIAMFYIVFAFLISWRLALFGIIVSAAIMSILAWLVGVSRRAGQKETLRTKELLTDLSDALVSIKPLKAMARHVRFGEVFGGQINSLKSSLRQQIISQALLRNVRDILTICSFGIGFYILLVQLGTPVVEFLPLVFIVGEVINSIAAVQQHMQEAATEESAYHAVHQLIEETESEKEPETKGQTPCFAEGCALESVWFSYDGKPVLSGVSIDVKVGELTVITGNSGAGKTTITDLLIGLLQPDRGQVVVDGLSLRDIDMEKWRRVLGYVPQEVILFHDTIRMNVTMGDPTFADEDVSDALRAAGVGEFAQSLDNVVGERGLKISGGQRQRIALARALVHKPRLLLLDEATSALDPETERGICQYVRSLVSESQGALAVLVITHGRTWLDLADRVYHLADEGVAQVAA